MRATRIMPMPEARAMTSYAVRPKRNIWALFVGSLFVVALIVGGIFLGLHLTNKKEGAPGNWTEAQIAEKANELLDTAPREMTESMALADLREVFKCVVKEASLRYAYDDDCFKTKSCEKLAAMPLLLEKCLGGQKGRWSAAAKDWMVRGMEKDLGMSRALALCVTDVFSKSYGLSELVKGAGKEPSTALVSKIAESCFLGGTPVAIGGHTG